MIKRINNLFILLKDTAATIVLIGAAVVPFVSDSLALNALVGGGYLIALIGRKGE